MRRRAVEGLTVRDRDASLLTPHTKKPEGAKNGAQVPQENQEARPGVQNLVHFQDPPCQMPLGLPLISQEKLKSEMTNKGSGEIL